MISLFVNEGESLDIVEIKVVDDGELHLGGKSVPGCRVHCGKFE